MKKFLLFIPAILLFAACNEIEDEILYPNHHPIKTEDTTNQNYDLTGHTYGFSSHNLDEDWYMSEYKFNGDNYERTVRYGYENDPVLEKGKYVLNYPNIYFTCEYTRASNDSPWIASDKSYQGKYIDVYGFTVEGNNHFSSPITINK